MAVLATAGASWAAGASVDVEQIGDVSQVTVQQSGTGNSATVAAPAAASR